MNEQFLWHFNPNNYGQEYYVLANSREEAIGYLVDYQKKLKDDVCDVIKENIDIILREIDDGSTKTYTLDKHTMGDVIQSEIA